MAARMAGTRMTSGMSFLRYAADFGKRTWSLMDIRMWSSGSMLTQVHLCDDPFGAVTRKARLTGHAFHGAQDTRCGEDTREVQIVCDENLVPVVRVVNKRFRFFGPSLVARGVPGSSRDRA